MERKIYKGYKGAKTLGNEAAITEKDAYAGNPWVMEEGYSKGRSLTITDASNLHDVKGIWDDGTPFGSPYTKPTNMAQIYPRSNLTFKPVAGITKYELNNGMTVVVDDFRGRGTNGCTVHVLPDGEPFDCSFKDLENGTAISSDRTSDEKRERFKYHKGDVVIIDQKRAVVEAVYNMNNMTIRLDNGTMITNVTDDDIKKGHICRDLYDKKAISHIGEQEIQTYKAGSDYVKEKVTIIAARSEWDMDVQFPDGSVKKHVTYQQFRNTRNIHHPLADVGDMVYVPKYDEYVKIMDRTKDGRYFFIKWMDTNEIDPKPQDISNVRRGAINRPDDTIEAVRKSREGTKRLMTCGLYAMIPEGHYRSRDDVDVLFLDGTPNGRLVEGVSYKQVENRTLAHPDIKKYPQVSMNEYVINHYLKPFGFDHLNRDKDNGQPYEIDIFNKDLKIGIEYDGYPWHDPEQYPGADKREANKNKWCKENGIKLIRVRVSPLKVLDDDASIDLILDGKSEAFCKNFEIFLTDILIPLLQNLADDNINPKVDFEKDAENIITEFYKEYRDRGDKFIKASIAVSDAFEVMADNRIDISDAWNKIQTYLDDSYPTGLFKVQISPHVELKQDDDFAEAYDISNKELNKIYEQIIEDIPVIAKTAVENNKKGVDKTAEKQEKYQAGNNPKKKDMDMDI